MVVSYTITKLLYRTGFLRLWAQKLGMKFRRKLLPSALFKENIKKKNILKHGILLTT
jgi:hypothetical protein